MIEQTTINYKLKNMIRFLCKESKISRSGYYHFLATKKIRKRFKLAEECFIHLDQGVHYR